MADTDTRKRGREEEEAECENKSQKMGTNSTPASALSEDDIDDKVEEVIEARGSHWDGSDQYTESMQAILTKLYEPLVKANPLATTEELLAIASTKEWLASARKLLGRKDVKCLIADALVDDQMIEPGNYDDEDDILQFFKACVSDLKNHFGVDSNCAEGRVSDAFLLYAKFEMVLKHNPLMLRPILRWMMSDAGIDDMVAYVTHRPFKGYGERTLYEAIHESEQIVRDAANVFFFGEADGFNVIVSDAESDCDFEE